jgi:hypothetical protein
VDTYFHAESRLSTVDERLFLCDRSSMKTKPSARAMWRAKHASRRAAIAAFANSTSQADAARQFNISRERVRQIVDREAGK